MSDLTLAKKLNKKGRRLLKNKTKQENLIKEIQRLVGISETIIAENNKIIMFVKEMMKINPYEIRRIQKQTEMKLENLIKSGTRISKQQFDKPTKLSDDMYTFLNLDNTDLVSRIEVVRKISKYIRDKKLQDPENRKLFNLDVNLQNLFEVEEVNKKFTYNNINTFIQPHLMY
jgi:chromatin remodeling complex protein RSC6